MVRKSIVAFNNLKRNRRISLPRHSVYCWTAERYIISISIIFLIWFIFLWADGYRFLHLKGHFFFFVWNRLCRGDIFIMHIIYFNIHIWLRSHRRRIIIIISHYCILQWWPLILFGIRTYTCLYKALRSYKYLNNIAGLKDGGILLIFFFFILSKRSLVARYYIIITNGPAGI